MSGVGDVRSASTLLDGVVYQPYYLVTFCVAGVITWACPQTWDWTRTLTAAEGDRDRGAVHPRGRRADDAGLQPVHLFHLLMPEPVASIRRPDARGDREDRDRSDGRQPAGRARAHRVLPDLHRAGAARRDRGAPTDRRRLAKRVVQAGSCSRQYVGGDAGRSVAGQHGLVETDARRKSRGAFRPDGIRECAGRRVRARPHASPARAGRPQWMARGGQRARLRRPQDDKGVRWLFYRPDVEYLTGRGFLEDEVLGRRRAAASEWTERPQPDPRPAILAFHRELAALGITLIVMPTPVKPAIHPEKLVASYPPDGAPRRTRPMRRSSMARARRHRPVRCRRASWKTGRRSGGSTSPATRTGGPRRWSSSRSASRRSSSAARSCLWPARPDTASRSRRSRTRVTPRRCSIYPTGQRLYPPERVVISRVLNADGSAWRSDRAADVLVLGDSFCEHLLARVDGLGRRRRPGRATELRVSGGRSIGSCRTTTAPSPRARCCEKPGPSVSPASASSSGSSPRASSRAGTGRSSRGPAEAAGAGPAKAGRYTCPYEYTRSILLPTRHSNS